MLQERYRHAWKFVAAGLGACALALFAVQPSAVVAGGKTPKAKELIKATATAGKIDETGKQMVTVTVTVTDKGWYIYSNPVNNEDFERNHTVITVAAQSKPTDVKIDYPAGKVHEDKIVGNYSIYVDTVTIPVMVKRAPGDTSPLTIEVGFSTCSFAGQCLRRDSHVLTVP